jgi:hypothetical protein
MPVYGLADTSSISCGAWIHQDYHDPTHFWLIKNAPPHGEDDMPVADSGSEEEDDSDSSGEDTDGSDTEEEADMAAAYQ